MALAILGASAALAGFVLLLLGIIIASYQSYSGQMSELVVEPFRKIGRILLAQFALCLVAVLACLAWLVGAGQEWGTRPRRPVYGGGFRRVRSGLPAKS